VVVLADLFSGTLCPVTIISGIIALERYAMTVNDYLWLVRTDKGNFFITVVGKWTREEAAKKVQWVFAALKLGIITMVPRQRTTGSMDAMGIIYEQAVSEDKLGFSFNAGKAIWEACDRGVEFEAELVRLKKECLDGEGTATNR